MTKAPPAWRAGVASDTGMLRSNNEDRAFADESSGIFLVVDGMGGHAAGETAAETAVEIIPRRIESLQGSVETRIREAIASANNEIHRLAASREEWNGMACVLTLAVAHDDKLTVGHVGDSRLYLAFAGGLRKLTPDHSPVGEREDRGDLSEEEAMSDPRRNQVFRDVGSQPRQADEEEFIETRAYPFRPEAAFLLCTDGLSDVLTSAAMNSIVQKYEGDPQHVAQELVDAANAAGGKDNVTVIFIAGPEFVGAEAQALAEARSRHSVTRMRNKSGNAAVILALLIGLMVGTGLGIGVAMAYRNMRAVSGPPPVHLPEHIKVDAAVPDSLREAVASAHAGDTVDVPKGNYLGPIHLKEGVNVVSLAPGEAVIEAGPDQDDAGIGIVGRRVTNARVSGFRIVGTPGNPLKTGLLLSASSPEIDQIEVQGASDCAVRIEEKSAPVLMAGNFHDNQRCGVSIDAESAPRVIGNRFANTGTPIMAAKLETAAALERLNRIDTPPSVATADAQKRAGRTRLAEKR